MTEDKIFRILLEPLENSEVVDYPALQVETANEFSKTLSNILYESFKNKTSSSHSKRISILVKKNKFL